MGQTYQDLEIIIADDRSTDDTRDLVRHLSEEDHRISYVTNDDVRGAAGARNTGIMHASGEYITFQDSDDYYVPEKIEKLLHELNRHPECCFCYSRFRKELPDGRYYIYPLPDMTADDLSGDIYTEVLHENLIACPTLLIQHEFLDATGYFDTAMIANEDYDLAVRIAGESPAAFVDEVLLISPTTPESLSLDVRKSLSSSCQFVLKHKNELLRTGTLNHRLERILTDAQQNGLLAEIEPLLEKIMML